MNATTRLHIIVTATRPLQQLSEYDTDVAGVYAVEIPADVPMPRSATQALDRFHREVAIDVLDDFDICVTDAQGMPVEEDGDEEAYSNEAERQLIWLGRIDSA